MKRAIIGAGALVALVALAVPSPAMAGRASATITFDYDSSDGMGNYTYGGTIDSSRSKCHSSRKITVYREEGAEDQKIGSTKSIINFLMPGEPSLWGVEDSPHGGPGTYYAQADKTRKCKKAVSEPYSPGT